MADPVDWQVAGQAGDGQRVVQAGCPAQGVGMPRVVPAGAQHGRGVGRGGYAYAGAHVAEIARILQQDHGRGARVAEHGRHIDDGPLGQRDHAGGGRQRRELSKHIRGDLMCEREHLRAHIGRQLRGELLQLCTVGAGDLQHVGAETQGVLERVQSLEHRQRRVAPRAAISRDERSVARHPAIIGWV